jgi:hypothetical protein
MYSLLRNEKKLKNTNFHCDKFEWYDDELLLKKKLKKNPFEIPKLKKKIEYFYGMYLKVNVKNLKNKVLYIHKTHNCATTAVYDMMYVQHDIKKITMFQIASRFASKHVFKMKKIDIVFKYLKVLKENYTVNIVFVNDLNQINATGFYLLFFFIIIKQYLTIHIYYIKVLLQLIILFYF